MCRRPRSRAAARGGARARFDADIGGPYCDAISGRIRRSSAADRSAGLGRSRRSRPRSPWANDAPRLDLGGGRRQRRFLALLSEADVIIHGYRPDALERLGLGAETRRSARPGLIDVSLDAYGWTGPWAGRRGFDSLVQMSCGIADEGMRRRRRRHPEAAAGSGARSCDGIFDGRRRRARPQRHGGRAGKDRWRAFRWRAPPLC